MLSVFNGATAFQQPTSPVIPLNTWTFIAWKIEGLTWTFYYNNTIVTYSKTNVALKTKTVNYIGRTHAGGNLGGEINNFFLYNGALSNQQILDFYNKGVNPNEDTYYYTMPIQQYTYQPYNQLNYYYDFNAKPTHPFGTNKYKMTSSFISYGTSNITTLNNNMLYYLIRGLGTVKCYPYNNYYKNIVFKLDSQKWIDESPELTSIIDSLRDTGLITVEIRLISNNELSTDNLTWGQQVSNYMINILFEPIE